MGSSRNFRTIVKQPTVASRFNTYLIDARNHGDSPHTKTHTIKELADDLLEYVQKEGLEQRLTLMGHSMGGLALMEFTKLHPEAQKYVDRVIIIDIPSDPVRNYPSFQKTGNMLKALSRIDLSQPLPIIHQEIDKVALSKEIAALLKTNLTKK
jgi:abhydrolase domain-containing protein 11